ncbi:MAG: exo-alpha-sialidase [Verrucomicrobia bacterium]|nr:exo-alpha-sialidase [Verrucomicrobiota bacterium]
MKTSRRKFLQTAIQASIIAGASHALPARAAGAPNLSLEVKPFPRASIAGLYTQTIWSDGRHNGFPGIARIGDYYYVTFRNSDSHQAPSSKIVVIRAKADDLKKWGKVAEWTRDHDCRDPLVFDNHGKVQVVFHSKEDFFSQSADGVTWSEPRELETEFVEPKPDSGLVFTSQRRWLFRIRKGPDGAFYSLARCGIKKDKTPGIFGLILYRSEDGVKFKAQHTYGEGPTRAMAKGGPGSGWGHEADVAWTPDGTLVSAIRNSSPGVIVFGAAPNGPWKSFSTGANNFGGPALHMTKKGGLLLAARDVREPRPDGYPAVCKVWTVTESGVENPWIIPSGGDNAYQSFADGAKDDEVLLCYYSSHEFPTAKGAGFNPANLYLAHLKVRHREP